MNKSILMTQYKELYGGFYLRKMGRWFWKANSEMEEVGPISGFWLMQKIREAKERQVPSIEFAKLPEQPKVEEVKVEEKVQQEAPKKSPPKKPSSKKPVQQKQETPATEQTGEQPTQNETV
jgi:hypothetical protein